MFLGRGANPLRTNKLGLHSLRALLNVIAMLAYFLALTMEPLATIVALSFTAPLFATLGAMLFLKERVSPLRGVALLVGLGGALIILRPWSVTISDGALLLLLSSTLWAGALVVIKVMSRTESAVTIALYASLLQVPFAFVAALFYWQWPTLEQFFVLVGIAVFGVTEIWILVGGTVVFAGVFLNALFDRHDRIRAKAVAPLPESPQIPPETGETKK